jgi:hypothetical protein
MWNRHSLVKIRKLAVMGLFVKETHYQARLRNDLPSSGLLAGPRTFVSSSEEWDALPAREQRT